jgi:hypothetical protein
VKGKGVMIPNYNKQTASFIAAIIENMPKISADTMQGWIENPSTVKKVLKEAFCPPSQNSKDKP